jgi:hypothetical protein
VAEALKGARAVIVTGKLGPHLVRLAAAAGVKHLVLPSLAGDNLHKSHDLVSSARMLAIGYSSARSAVLINCSEA